ncbi:MAG: hypothetical protein OXI48_09230 [bacterium]|nr:hypothetical protein [bacterium]
MSRTGATGSPLTVELVVAETGDMVAPSEEGPRSVNIPVGHTSASFEVATVGDSDREQDSVVTVRVDAGAGYGVVAPGSASVTVADDDAPPPSVTIRALSRLPVTEGASIAFAVSRGFGDPTAAALTVNVRVSETGDVVPAGEMAPRSVTIAAGARAATFSVATTDDSVAEDDSVVTVEVAAAAGYSFHPRSGSDSVAVYDNDDAPPTVAVRPVQDAADEDVWAEFTVIHTGDTTSPLAVQLRVSETADVLHAGDKGLRPFTIPAGANSATLRLSFVDDAVNEWYSTVTVALASGAGYSVGSPGSASVVVDDNDPPRVGVTPAASPVSEGAAASFTVSDDLGPSRRATTVLLRVSETGSMTSPAPLVSVTIPAGQLSAAFEVATVDDDVTEADSVVTASILSVDGYWDAVHPSGDRASASVVVHDDENTKPRVTVSAATYAAAEGDPASFTVSRSGDTSAALTVALRVAETGGMLSPPPASVTIPAGQTSATVEAPTIDDAAAEDDSILTATISPGAGYTVGVPDAASVPVRDDDSRSPRVTLEGGTWNPTEGAALSFIVRRSRPLGSPLTVALRVTETGDMISAAPSSVTIPAAESHAAFEVATVDDAAAEPDSAVTVEILSAAAYTVGRTRSLRVPVRDDDTPPTVAIQPGPGATEAAPARFIVSRAGPAAEALTVHLAITETGDMLAPGDEGATTVTIPAGAISATLEVPTDDDTADEDDSTVTATLTGAASYAIGAPTTASVTVTDND